jgi:peptide/nickel transport system ATP-binding protein
MTLLVLDHLVCTLDGTEILHGVNLRVKQGEIVGLVGESGSGKSMTALAIMQLLPERAQLSGQIVFDGRDLTKTSEAEMCAIRGRDIGLIFQEPMTALNPLKTVADQIAESFMLHEGFAYANALVKARAAMDRVGLEDVPATRYPHELSGGQRQRIVIAMAIACHPKLIIADEPTSALDVTTQAQILALLREITRESGAALLLISHDLAVVASMADRIAVMKDGRIVEESATRTFFGAMRDPYARALYEASVHRPVRHTDTRFPTPFFVADDCTRLYRKPRLFRPDPLPVRAVDKVSLAIRPGESVGLVGESGSGKSTLARALLGLDPLDAGTITLDGVRLDPTRKQDRLLLRRKVQMVFQDPYSSFDPRRTIGWSIAEALGHLTGPVAESDRMQRVAALLAQVELTPDFAARYPHEMSGGQRQRAAIARALMTDPELIVLDEPVSALDVSIRARILDLLAELQSRRAVAYLFITHDLSLLRAVTDRTLVMQKGKIVEDGETSDLLDRPQHAYTRALIAASPDLPRI